MTDQPPQALLDLLPLLRCPLTGQELHLRGQRLVTADGSRAYLVREGIPVLLPEAAEELARAGELPVRNA